MNRCISIGILILAVFLVLTTMFWLAPTLSAQQDDATPVVEIDAGQLDAAIEFPGVAGETILADALSLEFLGFVVAASNPFESALAGPIELNAIRAVYDPALGTMALVMSTNDVGTTTCSLQAIYNPETNSWSFRCNPNGECPDENSCTLLRNGSPVVPGEPIEPGDGSVTYECDCR